MDGSNLKTACLYINNQLLSRGLLRNGANIDFARPDRGEGGVEATMGRIMGVVNDLILRRDRDAVQRETLTTTIRTIKADALRNTTELERMETKYSESQRKLSIKEAEERAMRLQLKSAESKERGLREEMARMKEFVKQTRNQCAIEVRKRERVVEGLKKHIGDGRVRGGGKNPGVREIVVVAGVGGKESKDGTLVADVGEEGYDLRSETNEFLTELARGLSEENENLASLARRTLGNLKTLSGWEKERTVEVSGGTVLDTEIGYETLERDMESVIEHVRTLLTNPSFVPLEEVEVREEEIIRLREGWERMESRWREAVQMMDGWRKRMAKSGQTVNLEELKMGLMLSPLKPKVDDNAPAFQLSVLQEEGEGDTQADIEAMDEIVEPGFDDEMDDSGLDSDLPEDEDVMLEAHPKHLQEQEDSFDSQSSAIIPPQLSPLREASGNRGTQPSPMKEKEGFTTIVEENTFDLLQLATSPSRTTVAAESVKATPPSASNLRGQQSLSTPPDDEIVLLKASLPADASQSRPQNSSSPQKNAHAARGTTVASTSKLRMGAESRLPRPREKEIQQSPLTMASIAAKLAASEREADAARVRAKLKAARAGRAASNPNRVITAESKIMAPLASTRCVENEVESNGRETETTSGEVRSRKRKAIDMGTGRREGGRASRRRSTLSPWELESLILGGVGAASPEKS